jgi:hypothetical protein
MAIQSPVSLILVTNEDNKGFATFKLDIRILMPCTLIMKRCLNILTLFLIISGCINKQTKKVKVSSGKANLNCNCEKDSILSHIISCEPKTLTNGSKLYWSYNCDSSWITFEGKNRIKRIIFTLGDGLVQLTNRLGHTGFKEFKTTFLYTNRVISGCCDPDNYYLYSKATGKLLKVIDRVIYVPDSNRIPFIVSVANYDYGHGSEFSYNSLTLYNIDSQKSYKIAIKKGEIEKGMKNNKYLFPEYIFDTSLIDSRILIVKYFTEKYSKGVKLKYKTIKIDLKAYS